MLKLMFVCGTRPEVIKLAPVIKAAFENPADFTVRVCVTGQHREMLDQMLAVFGIKPDYDLALMQPDQDLADISSRTIKAVAELLKTDSPDWIIVQGDTTTVWAAAVAAFFSGVKVAHVEAGLRTGDRRQPFPEEINRRIVSHIADLHFAPTEWARNNLLAEGIPGESVFVTGNTVIDALEWVLEKIDRRPDQDVLRIRQWHAEKIGKRKFVLLTCHRRESFGPGLEGIFSAVRRLAESNPALDWVFPAHLNPRVLKPAEKILGGLENAFIISPQSYTAFAWLMRQAILIMTDSGGIQEEAPSLGKRVLLLRDRTERPEGLAAGAITLAGTSGDSIESSCREILESGDFFFTDPNPYGDGRAAARIISVLKQTAEK